MAQLRSRTEWQPPSAAREAGTAPGHSVARPAAAARTTLVWVDDLSAMHRPDARRSLAQTVTDLAHRGYRPEVHVPDVADGDDLLLAATLSLFLHFKSPTAAVTVYGDDERIVPEVWDVFHRAMPRPGRLLRTLDRATFARMHYLVGARDHDRIDRFAPHLRFVETIADGDGRLARQLARALDIQKRNLQLMVTRRCQLRCVYCPADKRDEDLELEQALRSIELLLAGEQDRFRVDFAGGEPLLRKGWVMELMRACRERARARGKRDSYYLVTNAIEIDEELCRFLEDFDVELEISIDGDETSHNRNTTAVDPGVNPYQALLRGFEHVARHDLRYNAVLVFTPESFPRLAENLEHIMSLGFGNIAINYAIGYRWEPTVIEQYVDLLVRLVQRHDMLERRHDAPKFIKNLLHKSEPTVLNSELMVDTDGSLHLLSEWQFKKHLRRHQPSLTYSLDQLRSIDDVFFTKAEVYHLLYEVYRSPDDETLSLVHNSVETGLQVARLLRERLGGIAR
ncbi:MAG: radical SAM protein [Deltaproteobacteria bacterium]|jgi:uncharacterized Fe-S cluster-containing radical SAM superfamily protein|nr:radical SAM protein [Deltaproteobacteria bacterium]MBW2533153.1 radical SAM protein [Deltaproteobacteria bacterium]